MAGSARRGILTRVGSLLPSPGPEEAHLWQAPLELSSELLASLVLPLSPSERERAGSFQLAPARQEFLAARGWLRLLLSRYLGVDPAELSFETQAGGKPYLRHPDPLGLRFNLSHSGQVVVFAIAYGRDVGVDVEEVRPDFDFTLVAERFFSEQEQRALQQMPPGPSRRNAFYRAWTLKEAYLKGIGAGLGGSRPAASPAQTASQGRSGPPTQSQPRDGWTLATFTVQPRYFAAVAVSGQGVRVPELARLLSASEQ